MSSQKQILTIASILGFLAVAIGAFGAHALKPLLTENNRLDTFELAVRYHFYHVFALLAVGILASKINSKYLRPSAICFLTGILLFSGSLYFLAILNITLFAIATPFGGVFLLAGWGFLFYAVRKEY